MLEALLLTGLVSQDGGGEVDVGQMPFTPITPPRSQELCGLPPGTGNHLGGSASCPHRPQGDHLISSSLSHSRDSPWYSVSLSAFTSACSPCQCSR